MGNRKTRGMGMADLKFISKNNSDSTYLQVAEALKAYAQEYQLLPDDKLPSERELSAALSVSRNSVREGLRLLETQGYIYTKSGVGSFIKRSMSNESIMLHFIKLNFAEVLEIKFMLEVAAVTEWMTRATSAQIDELEEVAWKMKVLHQKGIYPHEEDTAFHKMLIGFQNNETLIKMLDELNSRLAEYWKHFVQDVERLSETIPMHYTLLQHIKEKNIVGAKRIYDKIFAIDMEVINATVNKPTL